MLNDEICKLRDKLNKKIEESASYDEIYKFSIYDIIFKDGALF